MTLTESRRCMAGRATQGGGDTIWVMPATQNGNGKITNVRSLPAYYDVTGNITFSDGEHSIQITLDKGKPRLVVTDGNGKEIFKGSIATQAELKAVPEAIRRKLELLHAKIVAGGPGAGGVGLSTSTRKAVFSFR